jgi:hypothetical protein
MRRALWAALSCALIASGCSADNTGFPRARGDASASDGGDAATEDTGPSTAVDAIPVTDTGDPRLTPDAACATQTSGTQRAPMNLLIVLDRSGSMADGGKWDAAVRGINRVLDLLDDETRVGLLFFPAPSNPDSEAGYVTPHVPIAPLGTNRTALRMRLSSTRPTGNTPMACAMPPAVNYYDTMFTMDGSRNVVLITDGEPTDECSGVTCTPPIFPDFNAIMEYERCMREASTRAKVVIQAAAARGARDTPPIRTFVVGTPEASDAFLSNVALNGGTRRAPGCETSNACHYSLGSATFETDLNRALDEIRGRAATCEFRLMIDTSRVDRNLVNVNYTPSPGAMSRLIPRDTSHANGWDYSSDGRNILLYGPICDEVRANTSGGQVQILFGCPTVTPG